MPHVVAFLIFAALAALTWFVSLACFRSTYADPGSQAVPARTMVSVCAIAVVALTGFVPFPGGYVAGLAVWAVAAFGFLGLSVGPAAVLVTYLAVASALSRLVVLGVLSVL